jgi:acyl-CoA oxidase
MSEDNNNALDLEDYPPGPLDDYRKQASFDWKKFKVYIENEDLLKFKVT